MIAKAEMRVLSGRYELYRPLEAGGTGEAWLGADDHAVEYMVRIWPFEGAAPDLGRRALWDHELRTLYRVGSTPGADHSLLTLHDAGVDRDRSWFVMVLASAGTATLAHALDDDRRKKHAWLSQPSGVDRVRLWEVLERLANGLDLLHDQQIIHRNVTTESVFFDPRVGDESVRLGGFEWSIRLGVPHTEDPPITWATPPERLADFRTSTGFRMRDDWFGFGMLAARCLLRAENYRLNDPAVRYQRLKTLVNRANASQLRDMERTLIKGLIAQDPNDRLTDSDKIRAAIQDIIGSLNRGPGRGDDRPFVVAFHHQLTSSVVAAAMEQGFAASDGSRYNPGDAIHRAELCRFLREQFRNAELVVDPSEKPVTLVGTAMSVNMVPFADREGRSSWSVGFAFRATEFRGADPDARSVALPAGAVDVRTVADIHRDLAYAHGASPWDTVIPRFGTDTELRQTLKRYLEFVRVTHQLELLFRYAEIFPYNVVSGPHKDGALERVTIVEGVRPRELPKYCMRVDDGLVGFIQDRLDSQLSTGPGRGHGDVVLTPAELGDQLIVSDSDSGSHWDIDGPPEDGRITLRRPIVDDAQSPLPRQGYLRAADLSGQIRLFERQRRALETLAGHSFLLRSLVEPERVFIDTGGQALPLPPPPWLDDSKQGVLEDSLRVRPIYALQGPPGTGKTTLVSFLIRQLMEDDPVVQVLVTAQAHDAVDVLRAKVRDEAFGDVEEQRRPLAVRLGARRRADRSTRDEDPDLVENVAERVLDASRHALLADEASLTPLQQRWVKAATGLIGDLRTFLPGPGSNFAELVKRSANLTYCTTSAGALEVRSSEQSFDWSIIEEAGKVHAFDLALPLQAGHRWLLIGDQSQLKPYRWGNYQAAVNDLDGVAAALDSAPDKALVDRTWLNRWEELGENERKQFSAYTRDMLAIFEEVFNRCRFAAPEGERLTETVSLGAAAGRLTFQHRMHPQLGSLISKTYYKGELQNGSKVVSHGRPTADVLHGLKLPEGIADVPLVWVDLMPASVGGFPEVGGVDGRPRYTSPVEADALVGALLALDDNEIEGPLKTAVLSPYNQQVALLGRRLERIGPRLRRVALHGPHRANSVDSFQGNEADVVLVSLVRNNTNNGVDSALGFLKEEERMNVLFSRGRKLLVLVGSFDFFVEQVKHVPIDDPENVLWHWKNLVTTFQGWFDEGRALRLDGRTLASRGAAAFGTVGAAR